MSAAADFPNAWATAEKGRHVDSGEIRSALTELDALRAELSALKARRCDGCAHVAAEHPGRVRCGWLRVIVPVDFSCAAWTEKP